MSARLRTTPALDPDRTQSLSARIIDDINQWTHHSIQNLDVRVDDRCIVVSGRTSRYYYKQLTTRAVFDLVSDLQLENRVEVCAGDRVHRASP
ncbi:MAG: hypothetical protein VB858_18285 [Planctomycetaceae bacterium]